MAPKKKMVLAAAILGWLANSAAAQEKADTANMAKVIAEKFAKEFIQDKNVVVAMKLISVPFLEIEQGREQKPKKLEKAADVDNRLREVVKRHDEIGIRKKAMLVKVSDGSGDVQLDTLTKDVFNPNRAP